MEFLDIHSNDWRPELDYPDEEEPLLLTHEKCSLISYKYNMDFESFLTDNLQKTAKLYRYKTLTWSPLCLYFNSFKYFYFNKELNKNFSIDRFFDFMKLTNFNFYSLNETKSFHSFLSSTIKRELRGKRKSPILNLTEFEKNFLPAGIDIKDIELQFQAEKLEQTKKLLELKKQTSKIEESLEIEDGEYIHDIIQFIQTEIQTEIKTQNSTLPTLRDFDEGAEFIQPNSSLTNILQKHHELELEVLAFNQSLSTPEKKKKN